MAVRWKNSNIREEEEEKKTEPYYLFEGQTTNYLNTPNYALPPKGFTVSGP